MMKTQATYISKAPFSSMYGSKFLQQPVTKQASVSAPQQQNFEWWHLVFVGLQYGTWVMSSFWHVEF